MRLTMPRRGVGVCVGACLTVGAFLLMAGAAWAASTPLTLCVPNREGAAVKSPSSGACEKNYT